MSVEISAWKKSTCSGKLRCKFLILKEDLDKKHIEKLEIKIMKKVIYVKRQLRKARVPGLRRYWRTRKEKTEKENMVLLFFFQNYRMMCTQHCKSSV